MGRGTSASQWMVTATVAGKPAGVWDTFSGGAGDSETPAPYRRGDGSLMPRTGTATHDELVISRIYDGEEDNFLEWMRVRGRAPMTVTRTPCDADGNPSGRPMTYTGILKRVEDGEPDSNGNDDMKLSLTMTVAAVG